MTVDITTKQYTRVSMVAYFLQGNKRFFALGIVCSLLVAFLDMLGPKIVQYTVDHIIGEEAVSSAVVQQLIRVAGGRDYLRSHLYVIAAVIIGIAVVAAVSRYLYRLFNSMGAEQLIRRMRDCLFEQIEHLPYAWHGKNHTGDIIQRCTSDVETIKSFLSEQLTSLFRVGILIAIAMYFMIGIHPKMALISGIFIPIVILYSFFFHNRIASSFQKADEEEGVLSAIAQENLTGVRVVRAFGREQFERERFEKQNHGYTRMWIRLMGWLSAFWCSNDLITGLQVMLVTVTGAVFCVKGYITVGEYIAFASYNGMLVWPVRELGRVIS
ncbi:MAG: ABC transporter ATP-binding protein, partial [Lachnospiraceae bacterium]|nr:ABC transporter ATP-binding protein [Lachnospiraceae bacterium]